MGNKIANKANISFQSKNRVSPFQKKKWALVRIANRSENFNKRDNFWFQIISKLIVRRFSSC